MYTDKKNQWEQGLINIFLSQSFKCSGGFWSGIGEGILSGKSFTGKKKKE